MMESKANTKDFYKREGGERPFEYGLIIIAIAAAMVGFGIIATSFAMWGITPVASERIAFLKEVRNRSQNNGAKLVWRRWNQRHVKVGTEVVLVEDFIQINFNN